MTEGLAYVGKIVEIQPIPGADLIVSATVTCGKGGKWQGIIQKGQLTLGSKCIVYLPDALLTPSEELKFMESHKWRVRMKRFKGAASEVLITPCMIDGVPGEDCTERLLVSKYEKPIPSNLQGNAIGEFPGFIPKTDEPNYQRNGNLVDALHGKPYYIAEKADGSSTTAFRYKNAFGVCSRNLQIAPDESNGYWEIAYRYKIQNTLPEGYALQWETCGPKIQGNPMGLSKVDGFAFSAYNIVEQRYLDFHELKNLCKMIRFPMVKIVDYGNSFDKSKVETLGEGTYSNGKQREGVVVRSQENVGRGPISFKVINLGYDK